jgi:membrane protease YdiL (CAAX protease family)
LFFLGLVLGWLAWRTRSLVASITLHAAFNGAACVLLVVQSR